MEKKAPHTNTPIESMDNQFPLKLTTKLWTYASFILPQTSDLVRLLPQGLQNEFYRWEIELESFPRH